MKKQNILAEYNVETILPLIGERAPAIFRHANRGKEMFILPNGESYWVKVSSPRLECLRRNQMCVWCGRAGNTFVLEQPNSKETPHLNLYHFTERGGYLLMTRDHILPVAWDGDDSVDNLQTMCAQCNQAKGTLTPLHFVCKMTQWPTYRQMIELESRLINAPKT